jgi:hypothetical protein
MGRAYSTNGENRNAYRILVGKPEGKRPLSDQDEGGWIILKWILRDMGWGGVDWIDVAQDREKCMAIVNKVINFRVQ